MKITVKHLVVAPNYKLFRSWLDANPDISWTLVEYVSGYEQIAGNFTPIIMINRGAPDKHILNLVRHPSRAGIVTHVEV